AIIDNVNLAATRRNLEDVYQYRGLLREDGNLDPDVYRNANEQKLTTNYAAAWARMGLAYRERGDLTNAVDCMRRALEIAPGFDPVVAGLGGMLVEAGQLEEADALYRERIRTHPNEIRAYIGLGYKAQRADEWEEALDWFQQALRIDPRAPDVLSGLYQTYVRLGRLPEAENVLERWLGYNPDDASARAILEDLRRRMAAGSRPAPE
ncbi:MAG TPA: tetratricopeptide repeat protein, partial [bacterium]|nr:tetratricopeptide repeat protein [bacterium]